MRKTAKVTYLYNSGFVVELDETVLVFDYYTDEKNYLPNILPKYKKIYFFVSHSHFDHWNPIIGKFEKTAEKYFISYDIHDRAALPEQKTIVLQEYDKYEDDCIKVNSYSSTDAGISFEAVTDGWRIFHAGDFNWWHWKGDTERNNAFARNGFLKQMKKLAGLQADIAFFPVDRRLEECCDWGVKEFCRRTDIKHLITMHNTGYQPWILSPDFAGQEKSIDVWSPAEAGESKIISK